MYDRQNTSERKQSNRTSERAKRRTYAITTDEIATATTAIPTNDFVYNTILG